MKCDTCGKEVTEVDRVMISKGYDKTGAKPIYNCKECFEKKEKEKASAAADQNKKETQGA